jgi:Tfp pilus assembly protein PilO
MRADRSFVLAQIKRHRFSIALASCVLLGLLLAHVFWLGPLEEKTGELSDRTTQQQQLIEKYQEKLGKSKDLKEALGKQEKELSRLQKRVFRGDDSYQLAAKLGELLAAKGSQDLNIKSYQVLASKEYGLYQEVQLKFDFTATITGLFNFVSGLQKSPTAILVQQLRIQRIQRKVGHDLVVSVVLTALMETSKKS